jgi:membrane-associated HD superfamily phosphohydrolase
LFFVHHLLLQFETKGKNERKKEREREREKKQNIKLLSWKILTFIGSVRLFLLVEILMFVLFVELKRAMKDNQTRKKQNEKSTHIKHGSTMRSMNVRSFVLEKKKKTKGSRSYMPSSMMIFLLLLFVTSSRTIFVLLLFCFLFLCFLTLNKSFNIVLCFCC